MAAIFLFEAVSRDNPSQFKTVLAQPEVQEFLLDPARGVKNHVFDNGNTLVHIMAEQSAACLRIFLKFAVTNCATAQTKKHIDGILVNHLPTALHRHIHDYEGRIDTVSIAALDQLNSDKESPFLKAVLDINITSVKLLLDYPVTYSVEHLKLAHAQIKNLQCIWADLAEYANASFAVGARLRLGVERNPGCDDPLLELRHIISAAISKSYNTTVVDNTPLIVDYFRR